MRFTLLVILLIFTGIFHPCYLYAQSNFYQTTNATVRFYSSAPVEDIRAVSNSGVSVFNSANQAISFKVSIRSFEFEKALMQEHFNENYMESENFPEGTFKGESIKEIDFDSHVPQQHILKGIFTVHGVSIERILPVTVTVMDDGKIFRLESNFEVACKDHHIKIPKILWENIAEVIEVNINADFQIISK